ncbi:MAG TPA: hypothetical protein VHC70_11595 [Phycisphaerales bacterium]|nr:hypothetical protein [Phycisphaerales bacterium]
MNSAVKTLAMAAMAASLCACDRTPAPPSPTAGQGINNLSGNPTSIYGKSAKLGKDAAAGIQAQQDRAANAANQIMGQGASEQVVGGLKFAIPEGWKKGTPSSSMIAASYTVPSAGNAVCTFTTAGGDVASNIERWKKQMTDASGQPIEGEVQQETAGGLRVTIYKATGTFSGGMTGSKQANTAFRGAIIQGPAEMVFVKLICPADHAGEVDSAWQQMVMGFGR